MDANRVKIIVVGLVLFGTVGAPAVSSAQSYRYANDDRPAVVVECAPGQRAVMEQRRVDSGTQLVARCVTARTTRAARVERAPQRSKTKTALMIAGSAASGAGVGGALKGKKGALVGAAVGGGAASIYESIKRR
jgi:hypothetical protein